MFKEEKRQLKSFLKTVEFIKTLLDSLPPAENIHLNLLFGNAKNQCDILVGLTLKVAELNAAALFFGQTVDNLAYQIHLVIDNGLPGRVVRSIYLVALFVVQSLVLIIMTLDAVERKVTANCKTESFNIINLVPGVAAVPHLDERFLHNILGLGRVERYAQGEAIKLIFQWKNICAEVEHKLT